MNDLITIIVPVYNIERYIAKCIHSILYQSYTNLEIIVVDDGSTDASGAICDELAKADSRLRIIHKENEGLAEARNTGLRLAQGAYIAFVDGDDYIEKDMMNQLYQRILQDKAEFALCNIRFVDEAGSCIADKETDLTDGVLSQKAFWAGYYGTFVYPYVVAWNKLYRKELFHHTFYDKGRLHEDEFILHKIVAQCKTISVVRDRLYNYVQRSESIMGRKYNVTRLQGFEALNIRLDYFRTNDREFIESTMSWMLGCLLKASVNLDLSCPENRHKLRECIRIYQKRFYEQHSMISAHLRLKSIVFLYFRPVYLLLKKRIYTDE